MELYDRIGTMVFTPTDRYIIGASDYENEEFRKKSHNIIEFNPRNQRDTVELSCIKQMDLKSENYMKTKNMCFGDECGYKMQKSIQSAVRAYCDGGMTDEQVQRFFMDACRDMRVYQA